MDLERFVVHERTKIQDEYSRLAVSKVVGKKDRLQQMADCWTNAFLQVSVDVAVCFAQKMNESVPKIIKWHNKFFFLNCNQYFGNFRP